MNKRQRVLLSLCLVAYVCLLVVVYFALVLAMSGTSPFFYADKTHVGMLDFVKFYQAGLMALSADNYRVYDPVVQLAWTNHLIAPLSTPRVFYLQYVPFMFSLMAPFALLPMKQAYIAWCLSSLLCGFYGLWLLMRQFCSLNKLETALFMAGVLLSVPAWVTLSRGQLSWFILAMCCLYFRAFDRKRDIASGIYLVLTTIKPQYTLFLAVPALVCSRWKLLISAAVCEVVLLAIAGFNIGWQNILHYPAILLSADITTQYADVFPTVMVSLRSIVEQLLPVSIASPIVLGLFALGLGLVFYIWRQADLNKSDSQRKWAIALTILIALLFSPHTHLHDCLLLAVAAIVANNAQIEGAQSSSQLAIDIWKKLWLFYPLFSWFLFMTFPYMGLPFLIMNVVFLVVASINYRN